MATSNSARPLLRDAIGARALVGYALVLATLLGAALGFAASGMAVTIDRRVPVGLPACEVAEHPVERGDYDEWADSLLDPGHTLGAAYRPPDLRRDVVAGKEIRLREFVFAPLRDMIAAAAADGVTLTITSGYRSYAAQQRLFEANPGMDDLIALPGHSEHQLGTTVDLSGGDAWLARNAPRFGFALSFPANRSPRFTCYSSEPWHYRYFGRDRARSIADSGLSPREWLWSQSR